MPVTVVTGSGGLIGSESVRHFGARSRGDRARERHPGAPLRPRGVGESKTRSCVQGGERELSSSVASRQALVRVPKEDAERLHGRRWDWIDVVAP
jgi:hypothetical protein